MGEALHSILNAVYVVAAMILMFGAAVFVHEWGHYFVARRRGMKVEEFAIGFGPKLFSWERNGVLYSWRAIPAGGFVKLPQMITSEALEGQPDEPVEQIPPASPLSKILVAVAGPLMNVVFAFVIASFIYLVGLPVLVNPPVVGYVDSESPEYEKGIREGDLIVSVDGHPVKSWRDVQMNAMLAHTNVLPVVIKREKEEQTYLLEAQVNEVVGLKMLRLFPRDQPEVGEVQEGRAAAAAGLQKKDVIVSFAGVPVSSSQQLVELIEKRGGQETEIVIRRGEETLTKSITPDLQGEVGKIGVALVNSSKRFFAEEYPSPWAQVKDVWDKTVRTLDALIHPKQTGVTPKDLSGPVGILTMLAAQVNVDYRLALSFLVLLNINLAILNLLPVPVLDGGHIVMAIIERITGPINVRVVEWVTTAFAVLLIGFMLFVTFHDIGRASLFKSMFEGETEIQKAQPEQEQEQEQGRESGSRAPVQP